MTYPSYPPQPQPQYPPQQQQPAYPPAAYPPPQQPGYPSAYPPQQPAYTPPPQDLSIDDFYDQPAAGGKSIAGWFQTPGQSISGIVARAISKADLRPQTDMQTKQPKFYSDRRPMVTMTIPLLVQPSPDFPDGRAAWIINAGDREDLLAAMRAAGCPESVKLPEPGAVITVTFTGLKQIPGFGAPKKVKKVSYQRPAGASGNGQAPPTAAAAPTPGAPAPAQYGYPDPGGQAAQDMVSGNGNYQQYAPGPQVQVAPPAPPQPAYQQQPGPYGQPNADWNPAAQAFPPGTFQLPQYAPPTPAPTAAPAGSPSAAAPPAGAPFPSEAPQQPPAAQQYAVPGELTPEQEARLRTLTGGQ